MRSQTPETSAQIAKRTGRPLEGLEQKLLSMGQRGELWAYQLDGVWTFKMMPWLVGIYEFQVNRMDREFAAMVDEYRQHLGPVLIGFRPHITQVIPIEEAIPASQEALTYNQVSDLIEKARSFKLTECICKKRRGLLGKPCSKPTEVCLIMDTMPGVLESSSTGGLVITREEACEVLRQAEDAGLVHLTGNVENGPWFICNCCGCCCGQLRPAVPGIPNVVNSHYYAKIDPELCTACGICADERCQVNAIQRGDEFYAVITERCIGCGLCATKCPAEAVTMVPKKPEELSITPKDEDAWLEERGRRRGVDFNKFK
ncbi:MAG: 4Fe-4S binding protein [Syntrophobacteraceae bacterium]|nr:4Fe-4S binding protein [Syntrophobacteraceae bacterium]